MKFMRVVFFSILLGLGVVWGQTQTNQVTTAGSTNAAPKTVKSPEDPSKRPITAEEVEHLLADLTRAYESRDLRRFMDFVPQNTVGRDRLQDSVRTDFSTLFNIRLDRQDDKLILGGEKAIYDSLWRRKAFLNQNGLMSPISDERRSQMFFVRGADGRIAVDFNHTPAAGGAVGGFPFASSYTTPGAGTSGRGALPATMTVLTQGNTFIITIQDASANTGSVTVDYVNDSLGPDAERFVIPMTSPGVFQRRIGLVTGHTILVTKFNGIPEFDLDTRARGTHTFTYSQSRDRFGLGGGTKVVTVLLP